MKKQIKKQKRNRKLLLLAALATFGVVGGTFGGTYAWFVAQRTAQANFGNMTASALGNLQIRLGESGGFSTGTVSDTDLIFTDISGDGVNLYRPVLSSAAVEGNLQFSSVNVAAATSYHEYKIYFQDTFESSIYLNASSITDANGTSGLSAAYRVAFLNESNELIQMIHNAGSDTSYSYISGTGISSGSLSNLTDVSTLDTKYKECAALTERTSIGAESSATTSEELVKLTAAGDVYQGFVTVRIWLEGQDDACNNDNHANVTSIALNFYSLNLADNA